MKEKGVMRVVSKAKDTNTAPPGQGAVFDPFTLGSPPAVTFR
jgi:hypothetical protein